MRSVLINEIKNIYFIGVLEGKKSRIINLFRFTVSRIDIIKCICKGFYGILTIKSIGIES